MEGSLGLDMARHESIQSAIKNLKAEGQEDPVEYLSDHIIEVIKVSPVISISSTIGDLQGGIAASKYKDNVGLGRSHGETIVEYGIRKGQFNGSTTFDALSGPYLWRSGYIERFPYE